MKWFGKDNSVDYSKFEKPISKGEIILYILLGFFICIILFKNIL